MKKPIQFQNPLLAFALLLITLTGKAQREAPKAAEISGGTITSTTVYNSKGTPAIIKDTYGIWTDFNLRTKTDAPALRAKVGDALFEEIANNCNETSGWPGAITSYEERNKVRDQMLKYVCYQIAEVDDKWILRVPASENGFLPYGVRPEHDIFFMIGKTYVDLTGSPSNTASGSSTYSTSIIATPSYTPVSNLKGPRAKVKDSFGIWTDFNLSTKADAAQVKAKLGSALYNDVADNCNETKWPSGISSYEQREKVRSELKDYVCYQIGESDDKWILRVPASENSFQPYNMRPTRDIYFMVRKTDVDLSGSPINTLSSSGSSSSSSTTTSSSSSSKGTPAKINATGGMYSTFDIKTDDNSSYLKGYLGSALYDEVAIYCKEDMWPSGIANLTARDLVRAKMNDYKAYKIAAFGTKYILRIPVDENKFMPYDMRPTHDIYFAINQTDVTLSASSNSSSSFSLLNALSEEKNSSTTSSPTGFEAQLNALLEGLPNNFENLKGDKIPVKEGALMPSDEWYSKVKLDGSVKTIIRKQWLGKVNSMQAYMGEFKTKSEAQAKYNELVGLISKAKKNCCTLVSSETVNETITSTAWLPFDLYGKMGAGYDNMILEVSNTKTFDLDKDYKMTDAWSVSVAIYKQK